MPGQRRSSLRRAAGRLRPRALGRARAARSSELSREALPPLVAEAAARAAAPDVQVPVAAQKTAVEGVLRRLGARDDQLADRRLLAPVQHLAEPDRPARDHALRGRRRRVAAGRRARDRPRAVRAPGRARTTRTKIAVRLLDGRGARVAEPVLGEPRLARSLPFCRYRGGPCSRYYLGPGAPDALHALPRREPGRARL